MEITNEEEYQAAVKELLDIDERLRSDHTQDVGTIYKRAVVLDEAIKKWEAR